MLVLAHPRPLLSMADVIDLTGDDAPPGPAAALKRAAPAPTSAPAPAAAVKKPKAAAAPKPRAAHALLWIPYTCKGGKKARLVGVYDTKQAAQAEKVRIMEKADEEGNCCGHGDILVGDSWEDEISLVVLPAPLFLA